MKCERLNRIFCRILTGRWTSTIGCWSDTAVGSLKIRWVRVCWMTSGDWLSSWNDSGRWCSDGWQGYGCGAFVSNEPKWMVGVAVALVIITRLTEIKVRTRATLESVSSDYPGDSTTTVTSSLMMRKIQCCRNWFGLLWNRNGATCFIRHCSNRSGSLWIRYWATCSRRDCSNRSGSLWIRQGVNWSCQRCSFECDFTSWFQY